MPRRIWREIRLWWVLACCCGTGAGCCRWLLLRCTALPAVHPPVTTRPGWPTARRWGFLQVEADGQRLVTEMVSDSSGRCVDRVELRKPPGWGDGFMQQLAEQAEAEQLLAVS